MNAPWSSLKYEEHVNVVSHGGEEILNVMEDVVVSIMAVGLVTGVTQSLRHYTKVKVNQDIWQFLVDVTENGIDAGLNTVPAK